MSRTIEVLCYDCVGYQQEKAMRGRLPGKSILVRWSLSHRIAISKGQLPGTFGGRNLFDEGDSGKLLSYRSTNFSERRSLPDSQLCLANKWPNRGGICSPWESGSVTVISRWGRVVDFTTNSGAVKRKQFSAGDATETRDRGCWSCKHDLSAGNRLLCPSCNAAQRVDPAVDYFQIFEIDRSFGVDRKVLEQKYKNLQKKLHPDLAASKSQKEQEMSAEQSNNVIQAYYTLLRPSSRAQYLLGLHGIKVEEEGTIDDADFLMEIMEIRESFENVSGAGQLVKAQHENNERIWRCEDELDNHFRADDLKKAVSGVQRLAYYNKIGEEILRKL